MIEGLNGPEIPPELEERYAEWRWEVVWHFYAPMITYRLEHPDSRVQYLKLHVEGTWPGLDREARRMRWAREHLPVPEVLDSGSDGVTRWLVTRELPGTPATDPSLKSDPERLVPLLAEGLRRFHGVDASRCPFDFSLDRALELVAERFEAGLIDPERDFHPEFSQFSPSDAIQRLEFERPSSEDLVVCHGDYCLPNVLLDGGSVVGFLDLAELGVADRWWDVAVATWSLTWNLGPGWEELFLESYGIEYDEERMEYYRLLYDVVS